MNWFLIFYWMKSMCTVSVYWKLEIGGNEDRVQCHRWLDGLETLLLLFTVNNTYVLSQFELKRFWCILEKTKKNMIFLLLILSWYCWKGHNVNAMVVENRYFTSGWLSCWNIKLNVKQTVEICTIWFRNECVSIDTYRTFMQCDKNRTIRTLIIFVLCKCVCVTCLHSVHNIETWREVDIELAPFISKPFRVDIIIWSDAIYTCIV